MPGLISKLKVKPPTGQHRFAIGRDLIGNTFVAYRAHNFMFYIYGMFKGRELVGGHLDNIISWHVLGERVPFGGHPKHGNIILVMGDTVQEIIGPEADEVCNKLELESEDE